MKIAHCINCGSEISWPHRKYCDDCKFITKVCPTCGDPFCVKRGKTTDEKQIYCSQKCRNESDGWKDNLSKSFRMIDGVEEHRCHKCKQWLPFSSFSKNKSVVQNVSRICRSCEADKRKERFFEYRLVLVKSQARMDGLFFDVTADDLRELWADQDGKCILSGRTLDFTAHIDHIIPTSKGGTSVKENLRWLDPHVNWARKNFTDEEFVNMCLDVVKNAVGMECAI